MASINECVSAVLVKVFRLESLVRNYRIYNASLHIASPCSIQVNHKKILAFFVQVFVRVLSREELNEFLALLLRELLKHYFSELCVLLLVQLTLRLRLRHHYLI